MGPFLFPTEYSMRLGTGVSFFVPVAPKPSRLPPAGNIRAEFEWTRVVRTVARRHQPPQVFLGPVHVDLIFVLPVPRDPPPYEVPIKKPDIEAYVRGTLAAMNTIIYKDDAQVVSLLAQKVFADGKGYCPGALVAVKLVEAMFAPA